MIALKVKYQPKSKQYEAEAALIGEEQINTAMAAGCLVYDDAYRAIGLIIMGKSPWKNHADKKAAALIALGVNVDNYSFHFPLVVL